MFISVHLTHLSVISVLLPRPIHNISTTYAPPNKTRKNELVMYFQHHPSLHLVHCRSKVPDPVRISNFTPFNFTSVGYLMMFSIATKVLINLEFQFGMKNSEVWARALTHDPVIWPVHISPKVSLMTKGGGDYFPSGEPSLVFPLPSGELSTCILSIAVYNPFPNKSFCTKHCLNTFTLLF